MLTSSSCLLTVLMFLTRSTLSRGGHSASEEITASLEWRSLAFWTPQPGFFLMDLYRVKTGFFRSSETKSAELLYFWDNCNKGDESVSTGMLFVIKLKSHKCQTEDWAGLRVTCMSPVIQMGEVEEERLEVSLGWLL